MQGGGGLRGCLITSCGSPSHLGRELGCGGTRCTQRACVGLARSVRAPSAPRSPRSALRPPPLRKRARSPGLGRLTPWGPPWPSEVPARREELRPPAARSPRLELLRAGGRGAQTNRAVVAWPQLVRLALWDSPRERPRVGRCFHSGARILHRLGEGGTLHGCKF